LPICPVCGIEAEGLTGAGDGEVVDKPDPTILTTESLRREIANLKDLQDTKLAGVSIEMRTLIADLTKRLDHKYIETAADIHHLRELLLERIEGMRALSAQAREDGRTSLNAAFDSAGKATDKTEQSVTKQITSLSERTEAASKATNEKIDRLTSRLDTGDGKSKGAGDLWGYLVGLGGLVAALIVAFARLHG
jgi:hypothetical protein